MKSVSRRSECSKNTWASSSLLSKPVDGEPLFLYLAISEYAISGALLREKEKVQWPVYYISKRLIDAETRYPKMEKLALALVIAS